MGWWDFTPDSRRQDMRAPDMSGDRAEFDIYRRWRVNKRAEFQFSVRVLNSKDGDRVGVLVRGVKECPRGIDVHSARPLPSRRFPADDVELARGRVDREHRDAVVTAVRVVEKSSARVDADLRGRVGAGEIVGQSRDSVLPDERATR